MTKYIPKDVLLAEINRLYGEHSSKYECDEAAIVLDYLEDFIDTLEVKEVDLEKLGEIARHLIAVKENIEDMRLDNSEWNLLKRIGYPESNKAQKGE